MSKLQGKVALVTGASNGVGAGIARELAAAGAAVGVNYATDRSGAEAVVREIEAAGGRAVAVPGNVSRSAEVARLLADTHRAFGRLDVLVNNAGVYRSMPLEAVTEGEFHREFDTNVLGTLLAIREALRHFGPGGGSVINIGSAASRMCPPGYSVYAASVNSVNPGATLSEGTRAAGLYGTGSEFEKQLVAMTLLGRVGTPEDVAKIVAFLASDDSGWLTGEVVLASGGLR
jgi:3-oxoacyl-[acyl-carrier protein] reductase